MKTQVFKLKDGRWIIGYQRHFWSQWSYIEQRFLSRRNAEDYARRFEWKVRHPRKYKAMLKKYDKAYFTGKA